MKLDKFTWTVIVVVLLLSVAAVITVSRTGGAGVAAAEYVEGNEPETPVQNAFIAFQRGDRTRARAQYSQAVLAEIDEQMGYDPFSGRAASQTSSRLRITGVELDETDPDRALVSFVQDTYSRGGLFGAGNTWSREGTVEVIREDGQWKINAQEFFY
ncbi:MAG TPA: hypothetical protein VNK95_09760 [Caldilineaceae bacterium]|nr:hypothetical protein [Caldilineaceae bacterium]